MPYDMLEHFKRYPEIVEGYKRGEKIDYLAAQYGYNRSTIRYIARRYGVATRTRGRPKRRQQCQTPVTSAAVNSAL